MIDPSVNFTVTPIDGSRDLLGKTSSELQEGVTVDNDNNVITGTSHYVTGYVGFNGSDASEQEGNFLAINITPEEGWPESLSFELVGGKHGAVTLAKNDPEVVVQISSKTTGIKVTAKNGSTTKVKTYTLNVTLASKA